MELSKVENKNFPLIFKIKFNTGLIERCKKIQEERGSNHFRYDNVLKGYLTSWEIVYDLIQSFPYISIDKEIIDQYREYLIEKNNSNKLIIKN